MSRNPATGELALYKYTPNLPAAIASTTLFAISTAGHTYLASRHKAKYSIPFIVGCVMELIGYAARIYSHYATSALAPYIIQNLLLLIAPSLLSATIFALLSRLILSVDAAHHSPIRARFLTLTFVLGDVSCFMVQSTGAGTLANSKSEDGPAVGTAIVLAGLGLQIAVFALYLWVVGVWHRRVGRAPTGESEELGWRWKKILVAIYVTSGLVLVRNLVRVVEFAEGSDGYIVSTEWFLYAFDAALMWIVTVVLAVVFPGKLLGRGKKNVGKDLEGRASEDGEEALEMGEWGRRIT